MGRVAKSSYPMDVEDTIESSLNGFLFSEELSGDPAECSQRTARVAAGSA